VEIARLFTEVGIELAIASHIPDLSFGSPVRDIVSSRRGRGLAVVAAINDEKSPITRR
jgi:hypothetical protein